MHADHVTGAWLLKRRFGSTIALSKDGGAEGADRYLADGDSVAFGRARSKCAPRPAIPTAA